jgi:small subunit ribosomal protein S13
MPRISGVDIPVNKQAWVSLQYIYGVGRAQSYKILDQAGIAPESGKGPDRINVNKRVKSSIALSFEGDTARRSTSTSSGSSR